MSVDTSNGHPEMDYEEHEKTYAGFIKVSKYSTILILVILGTDGGISGLIYQKYGTIKTGDVIRDHLFTSGAVSGIEKRGQAGCK